MLKRVLTLFAITLGAICGIVGAIYTALAVPTVCEANFGHDVCVNLETSAVFFVIELLFIVIGVPLVLDAVAARRWRPVRAALVDSLIMNLKAMVGDLTLMTVGTLGPDPQSRFDRRAEGVRERRTEMRNEADLYSMAVEPRLAPLLVQSISIADKLDGQARLIRAVQHHDQAKDCRNQFEGFVQQLLPMIAQCLLVTERLEAIGYRSESGFKYHIMILDLYFRLSSLAVSKGIAILTYNDLVSQLPLTALWLKSNRFQQLIADDPTIHLTRGTPSECHSDEGSSQNSESAHDRANPADK